MADEPPSDSQPVGEYTGLAAEQFLEHTMPIDDPPPDDDLNYDAWVLLANGAYWDHTDPQRSAEWNEARTRWRDRWHATLDAKKAE